MTHDKVSFIKAKLEDEDDKIGDNSDEEAAIDADTGIKTLLYKMDTLTTKVDDVKT